MRLLFVFFALGPGICGFSLAYLLRNPEEWISPALMLVVGLLITIVAQTLGVTWLGRILTPRYKTSLTATRWGGLVMGVVVGLLTYFVLLNQG